LSTPLLCHLLHSAARARTPPMPRGSATQRRWSGAIASPSTSRGTASRRTGAGANRTSGGDKQQQRERRRHTRTQQSHSKHIIAHQMPNIVLFASSCRSHPTAC
jgi:hypothetical protein